MSPPVETRARIFEAALGVCSQHGYHGTRMDEIARCAGVSKGGLYHHFKSKRDLFLQLFDVLTERTIEEAGDLSPDATTEEAIRQVFRVGEALLADERLVRAMLELYVLGLSEPDLRERFARSYAPVLSFGAMLIRRGIERGGIDPALNPERTAQALFPAADGLVVMHVILGAFDRAPQALRDFEALTLRALRPVSENRSG